MNFRSNYEHPSYKPLTTQQNEESVENLLERAFDVDEAMSVLVSDLTLVQLAFATVKQPLETIKNISYRSRF